MRFKKVFVFLLSLCLICSFHGVDAVSAESIELQETDAEIITVGGSEMESESDTEISESTIESDSCEKESGSIETEESFEEEKVNLPLLLLGDGPAPNADYSVVPSWYADSLPQINSRPAANNWQVVSGTFYDGQKGGSTQVSSGKEVSIRENIIPSGMENLFYVAMKVKAQVSWVDVLDATAVWLQNGNSGSSSGHLYYETERPGDNCYEVYIDFVDSVSPSTNGNIVYSKKYYIDADCPAFNSGNWFIYWGNPLLDNANHSYGKVGPVYDGIRYKVPVGQYMRSYDLVHHSVVAETVTADLTDLVKENSTAGIMHITDGTNASITNGTLQWNIHPDGTIPMGSFTEYTMETINGKKVYYREYDLVFGIHLDASETDFVPGQVYDIDGGAVLDYTYDPRTTGGESTYPYPSDADKTLNFPTPSIKGTLYELQFVKKDAESGEVLPGATFKLSGNYGAAGSLAQGDYANGSYSIELASDENGIVHFEGLPWGTYTLEEISSPPHYDITFSPLTVLLSKTDAPDMVDLIDGRCVLKSNYIGNNGVITNKPWEKVDIPVKKVDINGTGLNDAEFTLYVSDVDYAKDDQITYTFDGENYYLADTVITANGGNVLLKGLYLRNDPQWLLVETKAPNGYVVLDSPVAFTIGDDGKPVLTSAPEGVYVDAENAIVIPNHVIPKIPDAGGGGIILYLYGGILMMIAALLMFAGYRNYCRKSRKEK